MKNSIAPQKLDFLIAGQSVKVRTFIENGQPVAHFSGFDVNDQRLSLQVVAQIQAMLHEIAGALESNAKGIADGKR